ncbi:extracellular matrix protein 1 isoform X3 [Xyrauchen texanus]|uniref:extracellular matrix protein 1 isoform X2 n=1 Tax=Xyrauchen texanus TaxID=154827 RepID=UPI0022429297|nr:extracellular matrix protein 1 isoform X2 [Xyrauchen texanus]XP_051999636.1 extracellular matrix protein 1 isoform X3 [Xyrauchen texanus]
MGSSRVLGLHLMLLLVLVCEASEDVLQREVTLSPEERGFIMLQRPINHYISKLMKLIVSASLGPDMSPIEDTNFHPEDVRSGSRVLGPHSMGPNMGPEILFPPAFPTIGNLQDICKFSKAPVRYPKDMFPMDGFSGEHRQADAVNQLQPWYGVCCGLNATQEEQICCAIQAWKRTLSDFCDEEFSVKTSHYSCCHKTNQARWTCFDKEVSDSSYNVSSEVSNAYTPLKVKGFKYNPNACKG